MTRIKKTVMMLLFLAAVFLPGFENAQDPKANYYRVDQVITLSGEIIAVKREKCYHDNDFVVIYLKEQKSGEMYRLEVSPQWYFAMDLPVGSKIEVAGSYSKIDGMNLVIAGAIAFQGKLRQFRDKGGFPLWRGKGQGMKGDRQGRGKRKRGRN